ncbi:MAG: hypothetical protein J0L94_13735 [Rhodothermia bacterium]|nr:hypothetical protein [Rhodothermia bacterium]
MLKLPINQASMCPSHRWCLNVLLLFMLAVPVFAKPLVSKISYYPRVDGRGYVVWIATSERVIQYDLKRQRDQLILTLFNTDLQAGTNQGATTGPVLRHEARTVQNDVVITIELDPNQPVEATAYPERQGAAMLVALTFSSSPQPSYTNAITKPTTTAGNTSERNTNVTVGAPISADPSLRRGSTKTPSSVAGVNTPKNDLQANARPTDVPAHAGGPIVPDYDNPNVSLDSPLKAPARTNVTNGNPKDYFNISAPKSTPITGENRTTTTNNTPVPAGGGASPNPSTGGANPSTGGNKTAADILNTDNPMRSAEVLLLESEADALARQLSIANSQNQRRQIETALDAKLGQIFDAEQSLLRNRVTTLRTTATAEEKELQQRLRARKTIIAERKQNLLAQASKSLETPTASTGKSLWDF